MSKKGPPTEEWSVLEGPTISNREAGPEVTALSPVPVFEPDGPPNIGASVPGAGEFDFEWPTDAEQGVAVRLEAQEASAEGRDDTAKIPAETVAAARRAAGLLEPSPTARPIAIATPLDVPATPGPPLMTTTEAMRRPRRAVVERSTAPHAAAVDDVLDRAPTPPVGRKVVVAPPQVTITPSKIDRKIPARGANVPLPTPIKPLALPALVLPSPQAEAAPLQEVYRPAPLAPLPHLAAAPSGDRVRHESGRFRMRLGRAQPGEPLVTALEGGVVAVVILTVAFLISLTPANRPEPPSLGEVRWVPPTVAAPPPRPEPPTTPPPVPLPAFLPPDLPEAERMAKLKALEAEYWERYPERRPPPDPM